MTLTLTPERRDNLYAVGPIEHAKREAIRLAAEKTSSSRRWRAGPFLPITTERINRLPKWARNYLHEVSAL